jgi:hypothetical protein
MEALMQGIWGMFTTTPKPAIHTTVGGRIYPYQVPESITGTQRDEFPYVVYSIIEEDPAYELGIDSPIREYYTIQMSLFSKNSSSTEVNTMQSQVKALFDEQHSNLSVTGYTVLRIVRESTTPIRDNVRGTFHYAMTYEFWLQEEYPS